MTRETAASVAKTVIEGGISSPGTTRIAAEIHGCTVDAVRAIRRILLRQGSETQWILSMASAIENGWEDDNLPKG